MSYWKKDDKGQWETTTQWKEKWEEDTTSWNGPASWKRSSEDRDQWHKKPSSKDEACWTPEAKKTKDTWSSSWAEASPTGQAEKETTIPDQFKSTRTHYDSKSVFGKDFPKQMAATAWARLCGFQGRTYESLRLHELCYFGWNNVSLRYLMHGIYTSIVFTRSIKESMFTDKLLKVLRVEKIDIDEVALSMYEKDKGQPATSNEEKDAALVIIISNIAAYMRDNTTNTENKRLQQNISTLELKLAEAKGTTPKEDNAASKKRPALPVKNDEEEEEEDSDDAKTEPSSKKKKKDQKEGEHPLTDMNPTSKPLRAEAPTGSKAMDVTKWIKGLQGKAGTKKYKQIEDAVTKFEAYFKKNLNKAEATNLNEVVVAWGLPVTLAGSMKSAEVVRVLAVASVIAD